mmetsp:Transcript_7600/g.24802  ORF Transcript_7600/g.24802 Transcript_7600/m.24802 type:complete len:223 (+) Transcript_7600:424-1092(+)
MGGTLRKHRMARQARHRARRLDVLPPSEPGGGPARRHRRDDCGQCRRGFGKRARCDPATHRRVPNRQNASLRGHRRNRGRAAAARGAAQAARPKSGSCYSFGRRGLGRRRRRGSSTLDYDARLGRRPALHGQRRRRAILEFHRRGPGAGHGRVRRPQGRGCRGLQNVALAHLRHAPPPPPRVRVAGQAFRLSRRAKTTPRRSRGARLPHPRRRGAGPAAPGA